MARFTIKKVSVTDIDENEGKIIDSLDTADDRHTNAPSLNVIDNLSKKKIQTVTGTNFTLDDSVFDKATITANANATISITNEDGTLSQEYTLTSGQTKVCFTYEGETNISSTGSITIEYNTKERLLTNNDFDIVNKSYANYTGVATSPQNITGTTKTYINDMEITIKTTGKPLLITYNFPAISNTSTAKVFIDIDGSTGSTRSSTISSTTRTNYSASVIRTNLSAGTHTIKIAITGENSTSDISILAWLNKSLTAFEI